MRKMDKWFVGAPRYWFLVGAVWCAAADVSLLEGRAPVAAVPLFADASSILSIVESRSSLSISSHCPLL